MLSICADSVMLRRTRSFVHSLFLRRIYPTFGSPFVRRRAEIALVVRQRIEWNADMGPSGDKFASND